MVALTVSTEVDDQSIRKSAVDIQRRYERIGQEVGGDFMSAFANGARSNSPKLEKAMDGARDATGKLRVEQEKLDDLLARGETNRTKLVQQSERTAKAKRDEERAIRQAAAAYQDYAENAGASFAGGLRGAAAGAASSGQDMANEFVGGFAGSSMLLRLGAAGGPIGLALAGAATLGVVAGKQLADGLAEGMQQLQIQDVFQTRMGVGADTMNRFGAAAGDAWTRGFGASREDNLSTIDLGFQARLLDQTASANDVQKFVERMQTVGRVTGESQQSLALGARGLVAGGMVQNYTDALDLIIAAQEKGLNLTGDMMDTLNEYAINFKNLGLSGAEALGLIDQMYASNIRNSDLAADSLREFSISANDGSDSTKAAFRALGFEAEEMGHRFAAGGDQAKSAFGAIMVALAGIEDPQERTNIGLALFKTRWEEANTAIMAMDLNAAGNGFTNLKGKVDNASETLKNHENGWTNLGNTVSNEVDKIQRSIADSGFGKWFMQDLPDEFGKFFTGHFFDDPPQTGTLPDIAFQPGLSPRQRSDLTDRPHSWGIDGPVPGDRMPFDAAAAAGKAKPSFDLSQYSVDAIPVPGATSGTPGPGTPGPFVPSAPTGMPMWGTGGDPFGKAGYGYYQVDPSRVYDAETSVMSARNSVEQARIRVLELQAEGNATQQDLNTARNSVTMAERSYVSAQTKLAEAQQGTWKKMESTANKFADGMDKVGAELDPDFGLGKGISGFVENLIKAAGNLAAAPLLGQLNAISQANPIQGGYGALGVYGAQNIAAGRSPLGFGSSSYAPSMLGPSALQPGGYFSDAALLANVPSGSYSQTGIADLTQGIGDCSSAVEDLVNIMDGRPTGGRSMATGNAAEWLTGHGFLPGMGGPGDFRVGYNSDHMQATLPGGTNFNWGSDSSAAMRGMDGGAGAYDPAFTSHYYRPAGAPVIPPSAVTSAPTTAAAPIALPTPTAADIYSPANQNPALTPALPAAGLPAGGGGGLLPGMGMPQAAPFAAPSVIPGQSPSAPPGAGGGFSGFGGGLMGSAMSAGAAGLDMLAPGAGQAAQTASQLVNRSIGFAGQLGGILAGGVLETLSVGGGNPAADPMKTLPGRVLAGIAGARPAQPNQAGQGQQQAQQQNGQGAPGQQGQGGQQPGGPLVNIENVHQAPNQTPDSVANGMANQLRSAELSSGYKR